jgi:hypothetical protein
MAGFARFCQRPKKFYNRQESNSAIHRLIDGAGVRIMRSTDCYPARRFGCDLPGSQ